MMTFKVNPFAPVLSNAAVRTFNTLADELLNRPISDTFGADNFATAPSVNVLEWEDRFEIQVAAPGFQKSDFSVNAEKNKLVVSAKKSVESADAATENAPKFPKFTRREFNFSQFERAFHLPETVSTNAISAQYENGILTLRLPKIEPVRNVTKVEIG